MRVKKIILKPVNHEIPRPKNTGLKMEFKMPDNQINNQSSGGSFVPKSNG